MNRERAEQIEREMEERRNQVEQRVWSNRASYQRSQTRLAIAIALMTCAAILLSGMALLWLIDAVTING